MSLLGEIGGLMFLALVAGFVLLMFVLFIQVLWDEF